MLNLSALKPPFLTGALAAEAGEAEVLLKAIVIKSFVCFVW
jgi:hypothetical protein